MRKARFKIRRRAVSADSRINLFPNSCILSVNFIIFAPRLNGSGPRGRFERGTRSGCSAARLARQLRELEVAGSNPVSPTKIKTFALKGKGFLLWAYDGYSSPKVRVQEKRIPLYQAGSLIFVHPIRDSSGSEAERRNPVFPTERRDTKTFLFSFPDSDMSHGKRTAIKNCLRNSFCLCISHQGAI